MDRNNDTFLMDKARRRARLWLESEFVLDDDKAEIKRLLSGDEEENLVEAFGFDLDFGTGGLRGLMGVGPNKMNQHSVAKASFSLASYMLKCFGSDQQANKPLSVVVAFDSRLGSSLFAKVTAAVFSSKGFLVRLFAAPRPTPQLSFAIRHFGAVGGVVVTASHNPKEYNGYKVYWNDGAQIVSPHDDEIKRLREGMEDLFGYEANEDLVVLLGEDIDDLYLQQVKGLVGPSTNPISKARRSLRIVYTPLHGTGGTLVPRCLEDSGFNHVFVVPEQKALDGDFPTTPSPNPEDDDALRLALRDAGRLRADLVLATDPDADRVRVGVWDSDSNQPKLLNGNQMAALFTHYLLAVQRRQASQPSRNAKPYIVRSLVTTPLVDKIAADFGVEVFVVLTGFKYVCSLIKQFEDDAKERHFLLGAEESYGYLMDASVRDKDGVAACLVLCDMAAHHKAQNTSLLDALNNMYERYGVHVDKLVSATFEGEKGRRHLEAYMESLRRQKTSMRSVAQQSIRFVDDYLVGKRQDPKSGKEWPLSLPRSNVLQYTFSNGDTVTVRPSGTEPKMKVYLQVWEPPSSNPDDVVRQLGDRMEALLASWPKWN